MTLERICGKILLEYFQRSLCIPLTLKGMPKKTHRGCPWGITSGMCGMKAGGTVKK